MQKFIGHLRAAPLLAKAQMVLSGYLRRSLINIRLSPACRGMKKLAALLDVVVNRHPLLSALAY